MWSTFLLLASAGNRLKGMHAMLVFGAILSSVMPAITHAQQPNAGQSASVDSNAPPPIPVPKQDSREVATQLIYRALHQAVWGPPAFCSVRQKMRVFDRELNSFGKFVRVGRGSGKLKLSLQFPAGDSMNTLLQVSDGQRLHTIENLGDETRRSVIDLGKVRAPLVINNQSLSDPTIAMYLAIGGQAESLRKLSQQYEWHSVKPGNYGDHPVWILSGRIAKVPPTIRALADTDILLHAENSSALLPTEVRVSIARTDPDDPLAYWMYQVEQRRSESEVSSSNRTSQLMLLTEWADPKLIQKNIGDEVFEAAPTNGTIVEETARYLPPQRQIAQVPASIDVLRGAETPISR